MNDPIIEQAEPLSAGGAVIIDDGSPLTQLPDLQRIARGRVRVGPMTMETSNFNVDGLTRIVLPGHKLEGLTTSRVDLIYGDMVRSYPWNDVRSFEVETADDEIRGRLKPGELDLESRFRLRKNDPGRNFYFADSGPIFRIEIKFTKGGKIEIIDPEIQVLRLELFFTK